MLVIKFKYYHIEKTLLSVNYIRSLDSQIIPYNDDNEDQTVQPEDILNHEYRDELSPDYSVYRDGHPTHYLPNCRDVGPPVTVKDMYAFGFICTPLTF